MSGFVDVQTEGTVKLTGRYWNQTRKPRQLLLYYQNVRGLRTKLQEFDASIAASPADIHLISETWLTNSIFDSEVIPSGFRILRCDRRNNRRGGGVAIIVHSKYTLQEISVPLDEALNSELVCAGLYRGNNLICILVCVYIPPQSNEENYSMIYDCIEFISSSYSQQNILICGDFNLNSASFNSKSQLEFIISFCELKQINTILNDSGQVLDLVLVNNSLGQISVRRAEESVVPADSYHPPLEVCFVSKISYDGQKTIKTANNMQLNIAKEWNFKKANFPLLYESLALVDWSPLYQIVDPKKTIDFFYSVLNSILINCVPVKKRLSVESRYNYPVWYSFNTRRNIELKAKYHKLYKSTRDLQYQQLFSKLRFLVKSNINEDYEVHRAKMESSIKRDPKAFWEYMTSKRAVPQKRVMKNGQLVPSNKCADLFADYFSSVYAQVPPRLDVNDALMSGIGGGARIHIESILHDDVRKALKKLKPKRATGPDGIPPYLVKDCNSILVSPLQHIFDTCYRNSYYPEVWKTSRVVPVPKKGTSSEIIDFRPIAILSVFGKLFESILEYRIRKQFVPQLSEAQHGFRVGRSTCSNLLTFWTYATGVVDSGSQLDAAYFDFQKAFDAVDNDVLLSKFASVGFTPLLLNFFSSYLRNRKQYVQYEGFYSESYYTFSGVSQGSNLGPLEFLILINDLPNVISQAKCLLFADDLKLYRKVDSTFDTKILQSEIDNVLNWCEQNKLFFNLKKCAIITFSRKVSPVIENYHMAGSSVARVENIRDLGLNLSSDLTFRSHIMNACTKAYRTLGFVLRQAQHLRSFAAIKLLYNAFVRSKLESNAIIWSPYESKYIDMVEKIQKKFIRWLYRRQYGYPVGYPTVYPSMFLLGMTGYDTLELRRNVALVSYILSLIQGEKINSIILASIDLHVPNGYAVARRRTLFALPHCRTNLARQAPLTRALRLLNVLVSLDTELDIFHTKLFKLTKQIKLLLEKN